ncbi:hypothetical protein [Streptomyces xylophagus]|uniref:hypothetical protein n=1 Tax=Streptomyces xylophagus TaxID=285514 RepID=UPI00131C8053|nr:hypothetical protein [Streptomyces xylophagus]
MRLSELKPGGIVNLVSTDGETVGRVIAIHVNRENAEPVIAQVQPSKGTKRLLVPLFDAEASEGEVQVPYTAKKIFEGPSASRNSNVSVKIIKRALDGYGISLARTRAGSGIKRTKRLAGNRPNRTPGLRIVQNKIQAPIVIPIRPPRPIKPSIFEDQENDPQY